MQKSGRQLTIRQIIVTLLSFFAVCGMGGGILAASALPFAASSGTAANAVTQVFHDLPTELDFTQPSEASVILAADGTKLASFYAENRIVVGSDQISQYLKDAVVAIEDERFYSHNGIDVRGLARAAVNNVIGGPLAGGSSITQQYVKNAMIEEGRVLGDQQKIASATERSLARKLNEARYAIAVERVMSKDEILTGYLNLAQFGPSQWGVEAASRYFYGKPASDVTLEQAAMLAGITQAPGKWNPVTNPDEAKKRRDTVLGQMYNLNMITREQLDAAVAVPIADMLNVTEASNGCSEAGISAYFCEYVVKDVLKSPALGENRDERLQKLYRGGLTIVSTVTTADQQRAFDAVVASTPVNDPSAINMSLTAIEPNTGNIRAMVQNTNYGNPTEQAPNDMKLNLNVGMDMGGGQGYQAGSTFKVFTLVDWLASGHTASERVPAQNGRVLFPRNSWSIRCAPNLADDYEVGNLEGTGRGRMSVLEVTRQSINTSYVTMANQLDMCDIMDKARAMGVRRGTIAQPGDLETKQVEKAGLPVKQGETLPLLPNPAATLGSNPVTPISMASAAATLAADGKQCEPMSFSEIKDRDGNVIATSEPKCTQALDPELARKTTAVLRQVPTRGATGELAAIPGRPTAGKTGTANSDFHAWFMGYTPQLAAAVWQGHHEGYISMFDSVINGRFHSEVYGGLYPSMTFSAFMSSALEGQPVQDFTPPSVSPLAGAHSTITEPEEQQREEPTEEPAAAAPNLVGMQADAAQSLAWDSGYGYITRRESSDQPAGTVLRQEPAAGTPLEPGQQMQIWIAGP